MRRRGLIDALGGMAIAWPSAARAQERSMPVIGYLDTIAPLPGQSDEFKRGLAELGYVDGHNVHIEYRSADGHYERLPALAAGLVGLPVDVIAATGGILSGMAAKRATDTIPIVIVSGEDPVKLGLAESLAHPRGNVTGVSQLVVAADAKRLQLLHELVPTADRVAHLVNPTSANTQRQVKELGSVARTLGVELTVLNASTSRDFSSAFDTISQSNLRALNIGPDPFFIGSREELVALAQRHAVPTMYFFREFVTAGGLISYGSKLSNAYHQVGVYAGRILKGARPADLPIVQQSEQLELVINLRTANSLGLTIPQSILARAGEVIE